MGDQTNGGIAWTDETWNPVRGCSRVSPGCEHCYAERTASRFSGSGQPYFGLAKRSAKGLPLWTGEVRLITEHLADPLKWKRPRRIFVNSMSDLFHEKLSNEEIAAVFGVMAAAPHHTFQVLTKRPARMLAWFAWAGVLTLGEVAGHASRALGITDRSKSIAYGHTWPLPNVILGVTAEDQQRWDERVPLLLDTPAALRMVSVEPQLEMVKMNCPTCRGTGTSKGGGMSCPDCMPENGRGSRGSISAWSGKRSYSGRPYPQIHQVITGGESGPGARRYDLTWARSLKDECEAGGIAFFMKQTGANATMGGAAFNSGHHAGKKPAGWPVDLRVQQSPQVSS